MRRKPYASVRHPNAQRGAVHSTFKKFPVEVGVRRRHVDKESGYEAYACISGYRRRSASKLKSRWMYASKACGNANSTLSPSHAIQKALTDLAKKVK